MTEMNISTLPLPCPVLLSGSLSCIVLNSEAVEFVLFGRSLCFVQR